MSLEAIATTVAATAFAFIPVTEVVVYEDRAEVVRAGPVSCADDAQIVLNNLPRSLLKESLRASLDTGAVLSLRSRVVPRVSAGRGAELEARRQALESERVRLADRVATETDRLKKLDAYAQLILQQAASSLREEAPRTSRIRASLAAVKDEESARRAELDRLREAKAENERARKEVKRSLEALGARGEVTQVTMIRGPCRGTRTLELAYQVPHAGWHPEYDFHFYPSREHGLGGGRYRLRVSALVRQSTGEDWNGVRMRLSTARPRQAREAPTPAPFRVNVRKRTRGKVLLQAGERRPQLGRGGEGGQGAAAAAVVDRGAVVLLSIPHRVDVASDGQSRFIPVDVVSGAADARLVAVPSRSTSVFREVRLRNEAGYPLSPGSMRIYRAEVLVGRQATPFLPVGAEHRLSLGEDARFRVQRRDLADLEEVRGVFARTRFLKRALRTTVFNTAQVGLSVELRQQVPVSRADEIRVSVDHERSFEGTALDEIRGHVFQKVVPPPGGTASADLVYTVRIPGDWIVN
ncbi:MAG: mucoidy inhibitor MuiA family protein [Myxococcota bacterium]